MKLQVKSTKTDLTGLSVQIGYAIGVAHSVYAEVGLAMVITAGRDGKHKTGSLHYVGRAVDLRTHNITEVQRPSLFAQLKNRLEECGFDVIDEGDHFHIEFDPKPGESFVTVAG